MNTLAWIFRILILLVLIILAIPNTVMTRLTLPGDSFIELPLIVFLFGFLALGIAFGVLILLPKYIRLKWNVRKLNKEIEAQKSHLTSLAVTTKATTDVPMIM